jgi:hypothetical protein
MVDLHLATEEQHSQDLSEADQVFSRGTIYVTLKESPLAYAQRLCEWAVGETLERAEAAATSLEQYSEIDWQSLQIHNASVSTDLGKVSREEADRLVAHAYLSTAVGISVHLGTPFADFDLSSRLSRLRVAGGTGSS